jgi:hypothetical protein
MAETAARRSSPRHRCVLPRLADLTRDRVVFFKRFVAKTIVKHSRKLQRMHLDRWIGKEAQSELQTVILLQSTSGDS